MINKAGHKKVALIISPNDFCDEEYYISANTFESFDIRYQVACSELSTAAGMEGSLIKPDIKIGTLKIDEYNALCFIGGVGCTRYWHDKDVHGLAIAACNAGLVLGAICLAPVILANAGLLKGIRATAYPSAKNTMVRKGVNFSAKSVESDKNIITANGPEAAGLFAQKISNILML